MKSTLKKAIESKGIKVYGDYIMMDDGALYPLPLVQGNAKLGKDVWHSSTVPTNQTITACDGNGNEITEKGTCPMTCKGCYGTTNNYRYNTVKYALIMRTRLLKKYPEIYFMLVDLQLRYCGIRKLRIHAVGDFIKGEAMGFYMVLKTHKHIKAWTYTKVENDSDIYLLDTLPNCNVVKSVIPGCGFNFGHIDYIMETFQKLKEAGKNVFICRCGIDKNQHCSDCDGCSNHEYVLFIEHSTKYKAEKDSLFETIKALIESQFK